MKYHHLGIPTKQKLPDEKYLPHLKMYVSGYGKNEYGIEWVRYDEDANFPDIVKELPHVAFEVEDLSAAIEGKNVIIKPNSPSPGVIVAFIEENGAPIEFIQVDRSIAEEGI
ncbi:glyoxalase/bleomycin resistance/dioxygenase family protein [Zooshikella ganghwensis]|uniref:glyoxalase/bleomycin resistance/dioxygenase family protein n=1 Tax=Zooshikella ganghwensis TaxID=202772 RepID=UPI00041E34B2|nr:glyoxalase/bleomycin resistance/dioxygenase family protein [Zooshikella ganghwensis]